LFHTIIYNIWLLAHKSNVKERVRGILGKKQLIMEKSLELFAEQVFNSTSIQEITERCEISKGAFYLSFKSKNELILFLMEHFMEEIISENDQVVSESDVEELPYNYFYNNFKNLSKRSDFVWKENIF